VLSSIPAICPKRVRRRDWTIAVSLGCNLYRLPPDFGFWQKLVHGATINVTSRIQLQEIIKQQKTLLSVPYNKKDEHILLLDLHIAFGLLTSHYFSPTLISAGDFHHRVRHPPLPAGFGPQS